MLLLRMQWDYRTLMDTPCSVVEAIIDRMVEMAPEPEMVEF